MRTILICVLVFFSTFLIFSQDKDTLNIENNEEHSLIFSKIINEKFLLNNKKDTVFFLYFNNDTICLDKNKFFIKSNTLWVNSYNGNVKEKGNFKKWKPGCFLRNPFKFLKYKKRYVIYEQKKYYPKIKVGKWEYFDDNGILLKFELYDRYGYKKP